MCFPKTGSRIALNPYVINKEYGYSQGLVVDGQIALFILSNYKVAPGDYSWLLFAFNFATWLDTVLPSNSDL